jgi:Lipocalin-like domain
MNRRTTLAMTTTALLCLAVGLSASDSLAQQKSLKEQLVGTWTLVSSDQVRPDGSKLKQFGANPKGINVFDANGRFFLMVASADNSRIAARDPNETNQEEVGGLIAESIAYYGAPVGDWSADAEDGRGLVAWPMLGCRRSFGTNHQGITESKSSRAIGTYAQE